MLKKRKTKRDVTSGMLSQRSLESIGISKSWDAIMKINQSKPNKQTKPERHSWTLSSEIYDQQDKEEDTRSPQTWEKPPSKGIKIKMAASFPLAFYVS